MTTEIATRTLGENGIKILETARDLEKQINEQWNDEAIQQISANGKNLITQANLLPVNSSEDYQALLNFFADITEYIKTGEDYSKPFKTSAKKPHDLVCEVARTFSVPGEEAKGIVNRKIGEYRTLGRQRVEEAERQAEYERQQAEKKARKVQEKKAEKALKSGNEAKAEMHQQNAESTFVVPAVVAPTVKKTENTASGKVSFIKSWEVNIKDPSKIIKCVAAGVLPQTFLTVDEAAIKRWAKACGHKNYDANGLHTWETETPSARPNKKKVDK